MPVVKVAINIDTKIAPEHCWKYCMAASSKAMATHYRIIPTWVPALPSNPISGSVFVTPLSWDNPEATSPQAVMSMVQVMDEAWQQAWENLLLIEANEERKQS